MTCPSCRTIIHYDKLLIKKIKPGEQAPPIIAPDVEPVVNQNSIVPSPKFDEETHTRLALAAPTIVAPNPES